MRKKLSVWDIINWIFMVAMCIICVYPLIYVLFASFSRPSLLAANSGILLAPLGFTVQGYKLLLEEPSIYTGYYNTIIYVVFGTLMNMFLTILAAFLTSRKKWIWSGNIMALIVVHMFFGGGLIPFYLLVRDLGMVNTRWALIIPGALSVFNMIVLRTAIVDIPDSLEESAKIDGATDAVVLVKIILPLIKPALAVQVLFYAVGRWNEWFNAMLFLRDHSLYPLQLILREILLNNDMQSMTSDIGNTANAVDTENYMDLIKYCSIIVATVPILCIYPSLQKYFVNGVMIGSIKG